MAIFGSCPQIIHLIPGILIASLFFCCHGLSIIESSEPRTYLFEAPSTIFCESDEAFDLCAWSFGDAKCMSSNGIKEDGSPCRDFPPGMSLKITSDSRCGLSIEAPEIGTHDGEYKCLLGYFEDISSGIMSKASASISISVASPSNVKLFTADSGVIHLSNASQKVNSKVICSSEGGIPSISGLHLYLNDVPVNGSSSEDGSFILPDIGAQNDGDTLLCAGDQFDESGSPIYLNRSSPSLSLQVLYPPKIVNTHEEAFMYEFIANPEPFLIKWELTDSENRSLVYFETETEVRITGHNKYLVTLLIDLSNVTLQKYVLYIENSEGNTLVRSSELRELDSPRDNEELQEENENSESTDWRLILGIPITILLIITIVVLFYLAIRHCKNSRGALYSPPRDDS